MADRKEAEYLSGVPVWEYCRARSEEMARLAEELNTAVLKRKGRVMQSLPRHMRRRAASHNLRRLPVRVRMRAKAQSHPKQLEVKVKPKWSIKESRRKRRYLRTLRLQRMLSQFSEDKSADTDLKSRWLPTHIWHAKRFHMVGKYGWKLPYAPTQKCLRHSYHSIAKNCAVIDTSYLSVIQLSSNDPSVLTHALNSIIPSIDISPLLQPLNTTLYHQGAYPYGAIGPVTLIPVSEGAVWLVTHPAMRAELETELESLSQHLQASDLTSEIGAIQLVGPSSLSAVLRALPPDLTDFPDSGATGLWYEGFNSRYAEFPSLLESISRSPHCPLPPGSLLGYTALDPRLSLPKSRETVPLKEPEPDELMTILTELQAKLESSEADPPPIPEAEHLPISSDIELVPEPAMDIMAIFDLHKQTIATSQLFSADCRRESVAGKHSDDVINKLRAASGELPFPRDRVPLLLLTTSGSHAPIGATSQYGAGVTLFLPRDWVMTSWVALTYRGAKPAGEKEFRRVSFERQSPFFPQDCIDTGSYVLAAFDNKKQLEKRYISMPPDKRMNFGKLGVSTPFHCPWGSLVRGERGETEVGPVTPLRLPYYILRDRIAILSLQHVLFKKHMPYKYIPRTYKLRYPCRRLPPLPAPLPLSEISERFRDSFLLVSVHMLRRGCVAERARLLLPSEQDVREIQRSCLKDFQEEDSNLIATGPTNRLGLTKLDASRQLVSGISVHSEKVLKTARRSLKRCRKRLEQLPNVAPPELPISCCLYEPPESSLEQVGLSPVPPVSRECCGYVTSGDFSFCRGYCVGVGCVSLSSLLKLIESQQQVRLPPILLSRNPSAAKLSPAIFALIDPS